ncbi:disintegrin and metalloproteinase domain-containing protein 2 isoform X6 [Zootoca vivipara]|uniref:disintegrin and metalloproteinase domain-containing protein 2 isoform X6 n=1 Tax=Zootoca vivipara TaxID=8524 RepID=UPI00293B8D77|nr:disintegrin and metalloproteinase domain-containing protein 2 isoform X6 [Zootoca vivipara]
MRVRGTKAAFLGPSTPALGKVTATLQMCGYIHTNLSCHGSMPYMLKNGSQRTFLQVTVPQRIPSYVTGNTERMTFDIDINGKPYIIHLKQQSFLTNDFRVYTYSHGGSAVSFVPPIQRNCYYQGYIEGYTDSIVMLSTCLGLSGLLQFENSSYGIEPVESASGFQHLVYQIEYEDTEHPLSEQNYSIRWSSGITPRVESGIPVNFSTTRYVEMHIVVAKGLYDYMGSDEDVVMKKITQLISFINTMFYKLNMKIILSSMEFWKDKDKISTTGTANELLEKFVDWKPVHLALRPHDIAFLFVYRNRGDSVGSTFARKMCHRPSSAAVAMYENGITLETFSVIVAQLLGFSLGLFFDNSRQCHCPGTCLMSTDAVQASGIKSFSSCSIKDFRNFLESGASQCLLNKPRMDLMYRAPYCGNKVVEDGEQCDCGTAKECESNPCCEPNCLLRRGKACAHGDCCWSRYCRLKAKGTLCRGTKDEYCDLKEYCNGTSAECTENFYVQDGQNCEGETGICMEGTCQSADLWCRKVFGKDSKSGSSQCYEEINSQKDRMGHCGSSAKGYENCQWQDLKCGKLVCEYPGKKPYAIENAAIIYAKVQNRLCVTLDYMKGPGVKDPFLVRDGSICGDNKVCMTQKCVDRSVLKTTCDPVKKCNRKGTSLSSPLWYATIKEIATAIWDGPPLTAQLKKKEAWVEALTAHSEVGRHLPSSCLLGLHLFSRNSQRLLPVVLKSPLPVFLILLDVVHLALET